MPPSKEPSPPSSSPYTIFASPDCLAHKFLLHRWILRMWTSVIMASDGRPVWGFLLVCPRGSMQKGAGASPSLSLTARGNYFRSVVGVG